MVISSGTAACAFFFVWSRCSVALTAAKVAPVTSQASCRLRPSTSTRITALRQRQPHEAAQARGGRKPRLGAGGEVRYCGHVGLAHSRTLPLAAAQMILRRIVGDAEQPLLGAFDASAAIMRGKRLHHGFLL